jgi:hypothetical protein
MVYPFPKETAITKKGGESRADHLKFTKKSKSKREVFKKIKEKHQLHYEMTFSE